MQQFVVPSQIIQYPSGQELQFFTVNTHNVSSLGHLHFSPAKPMLSPRAKTSPDTQQSAAKHDKANKTVAAASERERAIAESNDAEEIVHYRFVEIPVERMVVKVSAFFLVAATGIMRQTFLGCCKTNRH
jgi:hypothetical protein